MKPWEETWLAVHSTQVVVSYPEPKTRVEFVDWSDPDDAFNDDDDELLEGRAHLTAAAPDLYNALDDIVTKCISLSRGDSRPIDVRTALAALRKARGEK